MPKPVIVPKGADYLPGVPLETLKEMQRREPAGKAKEMLQAAVHRKEDKTIEAIGKCIGRSVGTIHGWLARLSLGGLERRYDRKSPGRPPHLSGEQQAAVEASIDRPPKDSGFARGNWTAKLVARLIKVRFDVPYTNDGALKLARRLGFSVRKPRPIQQRHARSAEGVHREV